MGMTSIWHWIIVLIVVLLLFGAGKIPQLMGDMAKGVKAFKAGLKEGEGEEAQAQAPQQVQAQAQTQTPPQATAAQSPVSPENPPKA